jgi:hypothetical protein
MTQIGVDCDQIDEAAQNGSVNLFGVTRALNQQNVFEIAKSE